uniref:CPG4 domain-containing protein n=1 Tax=Haemonchus contortus TaxID=6289 RepID=A0A7I4YW86_HAECO|nr:Protein C50F4.8 [Haemonchus contortus]
MFRLFLLPALVIAFDDAPTMDPRIPTMRPHDAQSDSCAGQCAFTFVEQIRGQLGNAKTASLLQLNYNDFLTAFSNTTFFEKFCNIYHNFQHCSSKCEPGYLHQLLMKSAEIIDHYCVYNFEAIRTKFPCLEFVQSNTDCIKSCTRHHDAVTSLVNNFRHLAMNGDSTRAEQYLAESCEYVTCTLHCDVPAIAHRCDFETANLVIDLTRRSFASMEKLALDANVISKWPAVCSDIKTYRLPSPANPPKEIDVVAQSQGLPEGTKNVTSPTTAAMSKGTNYSGVSALFLLLLTFALL